MMPDNEFSRNPIRGNFLYPDDLPFNSSEDFEYGGIAHQDPSKGLLYQVWRAWVNDIGDISIQPIDESQPTYIVTNAPGASYISLTFDRNMRMCAAWIREGSGYLYWYDSTLENYTISSFEDIKCPRLTHDDKRELAANWSDIIFYYMRGDTVYWRQQRDRFEIEYTHSENVSADLKRAGMTDVLRIQLEFI